MHKKGSVIIVTYNSEKTIVECLSSLRNCDRSNEFKTIVVDNGSSDSTTQIIEEQFPEVALIKSAENGGFGAGNNLGVKHALSEWLFFLNPDTKVRKDTIHKLSEFLKSKPTSGCVGPAIINSEGEKQLTYFPFTNGFLSIWIAIGLQKIFPLNKTNSGWEIRKKPPERTVIVDRILGAAMMMLTKNFERIEGFDERFFLFSEEEDVCFRLCQNQLENYYFPSAELYHIGGSTIKDSEARCIASANYSRYLFLKNHFNRFSAEFSRWIWIIMLGLKYFFYRLFKGKDETSEGYRLSVMSLLCIGYFEKRLRPERKRAESLDEH